MFEEMMLIESDVEEGEFGLMAFMFNFSLMEDLSCYSTKDHSQRCTSGQGGRMRSRFLLLKVFLRCVMPSSVHRWKSCGFLVMRKWWLFQTGLSLMVQEWCLWLWGISLIAGVDTLTCVWWSGLFCYIFLSVVWLVVIDWSMYWKCVPYLAKPCRGVTKAN